MQESVDKFFNQRQKFPEVIDIDLVEINRANILYCTSREIILRSTKENGYVLSTENSVVSFFTDHRNHELYNYRFNYIALYGGESHLHLPQSICDVPR